ncbi:MAG: CBS domain-containing protein [Candidatus Micrarchaeia archaeon]|jgi:predicted transcriptional regulator
MVIIPFDNIESIASKIRAARLMLGLSQGKLAKIAGVSQGAIARIEKEPRSMNPTYLMVSRIVEAINSIGEESHALAGTRIGALMHKKLFFVAPDDSIRKALKIMKENDFSQIPVINSKGNIVGTVYQKDLVRFVGSPKKASIRVKEAMGVPLPEVDENSNVSMVEPILMEWGAVIVKRGKKPVGIFTVYDLFKASKIA